MPGPGTASPRPLTLPFELTLLLPPPAAVVLTAAEQELYRKAHAASAALFQQYRGLGSAQINKHLLQIMALLLPMRRICSGERRRLRFAAARHPHSLRQPVLASSRRTWAALRRRCTDCHALLRFRSHRCVPCCSPCGRRQPEAQGSGGQ